MSVTIVTPDNDAKVKDMAGSKIICVTGEAARGQTAASAVKGKIWQGEKPVADIPATPPADATNGIMSGLNYVFASIAGATCSSNTPYPRNTVAVWGQFGAEWDRESLYFDGICSTKTDCDP